MLPGGTTEYENILRSRDRKGAVEAICPVWPSLTVGARISVIFRRVSHAGPGRYYSA